MNFLKIFANGRNLEIIFVSFLMIITCVILIGRDSETYSYKMKEGKLFYYKSPLLGPDIPCMDKTFNWIEKGGDRSFAFHYVEIKKLSVITWVFYDCKGEIIARFWPGKYTRDKENENYKTKII